MIHAFKGSSSTGNEALWSARTHVFCLLHCLEPGSVELEIERSSTDYEFRALLLHDSILEMRDAGGVDNPDELQLHAIGLQAVQKANASA